MTATRLATLAAVLALLSGCSSIHKPAKVKAIAVQPTESGLKIEVRGGWCTLIKDAKDGDVVCFWMSNDLTNWNLLVGACVVASGGKASWSEPAAFTKRFYKSRTVDGIQLSNILQEIDQVRSSHAD